MAVNEAIPVWKGEQRVAVSLSGGSSPLPPANVRSFGAVGDGVTDDTEAIQSAIDQMEAGEYSGLWIPAGFYRVTDTLTVELIRAFHIEGAGATSVFDAGDSSINRGVVIIADGVTGPVLNIDACAGFKVSGIAILGHPDKQLSGAAPIGIRLQNRAGFGAGLGIFERVTIQWCETGFDAGGIDGGDGGVHNNSNASDLTFLRCTSGNCVTGFVATDDQQVNYAFESFSCHDTEEVFRLVGGNLFVSMLATFDVEKVVVVQDAGANEGHVTLINAKIDGPAHRTRLYVAEADAIARATFIDVHCVSGQLAVVGDSRIHLMHGHRVKVIGGAQLCNANGALFSIDANSTGGGAIVVSQCEIPNNSGQVVGTVTNGVYRIRDCFDEAGDFITDYEDP